MFTISYRFQLQSLLHHLHFYRRYFCKSAKFKRKFDYRNDPRLLLAYVREQTKLGFCNLEFPLSLFRQMMSLPRRPSIFYFNQLFSAMVKLKRLQPHSIVVSLSRELELSGVQPDLYSNNIVANCFCHLGQVELGFSLLGKSLKLGYPVESDIVFFTTIINGYILSDEPRQAVKLLKRVVKLGIELNLVTYGTVIKGLCSIGDNDGAIRLLRQMNSTPSSSKRVLVMHSTIIDSLCKQKLLDEALSIFSDMKSAGIKPDVFVYTSLIQGMYDLGRKGKLNDMLIEMLESNLTPDVVTYNMLVDMHCKDEMFDEALAIIQIMVEQGVTPDLITYTSLLHGCCLSGRMDEARNVVDFMVKNKCAPNVVTFSSLINGFVKVENIEKALEVFREMGQQGIAPNVYVYSTLIDGLCKSDRIPMARQLLKDMQIRDVKPNSVTYASLLDGLCKSGQHDEAATVFKEMQCNAVVPNIDVYNILIDSLCEVGRFKEAQNLFCDLPTRGCRPDTITYTTIIKWLCRKGVMSKAMELINKMERDGCAPNSITYGTIIKGFILNGDFMNAGRYKDIMLNKGFDPDNDTNTISLVAELLQKFLK